MDIITNTAELSCNQGTAKSKLTVTSQDFVTIEDKPVATEGTNEDQCEYNAFWSVQAKTYHKWLSALYACSYKMGTNS